MTLEQASRIVDIWGNFLEHIGGKLNLIFMASIPESLLPFPAKTIEEALNIVAEQHHNMGNQDAVKAVQSSAVYLMAYTDDKEAFSKAGERFIIPEWREKIIPSLKELRDGQVKEIFS